MAAIKALQQWCKQQCDGYRDVSITNMTTSFRDGLAFCAILHKHRPDLINFDLLSKENVYDNNHMAFSVAEEKLGIPALLDAEDMVKLRVPDRLSILTYVSQYYNYFHGRSPIGGLAGVKRPPPDTVEEPAGKKVTNDVLPTPQATSRAPQPVPRTNMPVLKSNTVIENPPVRAGIREIDSNSSVSSNCMICGKHVHLVQRHMADGKLYHRNCFKCKQCSRTLQPGQYKAGDGLGSFICTNHHIAVPTSPVMRTIMPAAPHGATVDEKKSSWVTPRSAVLDQNNKTPGNRFDHSGLGTGAVQDPTNRTAVGFVSNNQKLQHSTGAPAQEDKPSRNILNSPYSSSSTSTAVGFGNSIKDNSSTITIGSNQQNKVDNNYLNTSRSVAHEQPKKPSSDLLTHKGKSEPQKDPLPSNQQIKSPNFTINSISAGRMTTLITKDEPKETSPKPWELSAAKNKAARERFFQTSPAVVEPANKVSSRDVVSPKSSDGPGKSTASSLSPGITDSSTEKDNARNYLLKTLGGPTSPKPSGEAENPSPVYRPHRLLNEKTADPSNSSTKVEPARPVPKERKNKNDTAKAVLNPEPLLTTPTYSSKGITTPSTGNSSSTTKGITTPSSGNSSSTTKGISTPITGSSSSTTKGITTPSSGNSSSTTKGISTPITGNGSSTTKSYLSKSGPGQRAEEISSKGPVPNSNVSKQETPENWRQNLKPIAKTPQTPGVVQPKVYPLPKDVENAAKTTPSPQKTPTIINSVKTTLNFPGKENKPSECLTPPAAKSKEDKASSSPTPPRKKLLPVNLDLINDWPKPVQKWQDVSLKDDTKRPAAHSSVNERSKNYASRNKARPEYIPEEEIQRQLQIIEQELDALEQQGVEMEKQLRSCDGDESEDTLMVDWFKLIHEKQLLLRQESELNYISKQQALEDKQSNVDTELRNLMNKPDDLKTPADREREKQLLDQLLVIVNDRSGIVECLDEDRIREKEEDEIMEAMIQRHSENHQKEASPEPNLKRRSRFSFSGLFKPKDKSKT
ncbi:hypothetical protein XENTR_v10024102 [Xenopus tropicalis]|uniref:MICAL-like 2 n=2 Tax=Xenopus tropicalis TaxID=8364 RepID=A0A6I8Q2M0_XENTR|nr:MICAL-like protein 2 isoform X1 [Xenopus tropicalis]KAE8579592.1 hypothetical protein XENTR_v10024102 [Xenopus tropicalis]